MAANEKKTTAPKQQADSKELYDTAFDAYIYGYPAIYMDITRQIRTVVAAYDPVSGRAPMNQMGLMLNLLDASFTDVVRANVDTLYSSAFLDLAQEPMVLSYPNFGDHYFMLPILDQWTEVIAVPGTRTTGQDAAVFALLGPNWQGKLPGNMQPIRATTNRVWIPGRIKVTDPSDVPVVNVLQRQLRITPLSAWGTSYTPPDDVPLEANVDPKTPPVNQVANLDGLAFFRWLAELIETNPPHENDYPIIHRLERIGFRVGDSFDPDALTLQAQATIQRAAKDALTYIQQTYEGPWAPTVNGWQIFTQGGTYGTHYLIRAIVAYALFGYNLPEDAIYPNTRMDADGKRLNSANNYRIHMTKEQIPPVAAFGFWSLTMYTKDGFFVPNALNRAALRGERISPNPDGSVDLYIQSHSPGTEQESNWLPAPDQADFEVQFRLYAPLRSALDGRWVPEAVRRA